MKKLKFYTKSVMIIAILFAFVSCAVNPVTGKKQLMLMSENQEVQLGMSYDPQVVATFGEYKNDQLLTFLQTHLNAMGLISHRPNLNTTLKYLILCC
jgi:predicted Zn-dependent protease